MPEERRVVTILFADVAGSTRLGEELDPEDVRALLSRYFEIAERVVGDHGGTLEKFIGDAVMAVFGLPRAHGDDAERGAAAACVLREEIRADRQLELLQVRFGLATGEVVASREVEDGQFLVTGDAVNVAARLQQAAEPWEILATERTAFDAGARFDFGGLRDLEVKGRGAAVRVRTLLSTHGGRATRPRVEFVGREDELDQLRITARRAFRDRSPAVVSIVAAAGTGKTRLVEQFTGSLLPELAPAARVETAQCLPYGRQLTYWPLRSVLFSLASIPETATADQVVRGLADWLGSSRDGELLAATVGAENAESADPTELFAAWRAAFAKAAGHQPLVLVFEDLHWSSDSLLDLVEFVMDPREQVPVLIVAIARPELLERRPTWGGGRKNFLSLYLDPLPEGDIVSVVAPLLEGAPDELIREVVRRSEGNPFFAGELARAAVEADGIALPDTVQATVLARLDLLENEQRRVLQAASVFGRSFRPEGVVALAPDLAPKLEGCLDALQSRDLLRRQDAEHLVFRHILIRDVAYSTLPRTERARLHGAAGDWFESRAAGRGEAVAEIVALHFREAALQRGPAEVRKKAVLWLRRAAEAALAAAATREAAEHLRAAIEIAEEGDETAELWTRLGDVQVILPGATDAYLRGYELAVSPRVRLIALNGVLMTGMRWLFSFQLDPDHLPGYVAEGERLVAEVGDRELEGRFLAALAFKPYWARAAQTQVRVELSPEEVEQSRQAGRRALAIAEELDLPDLASQALDGLGGIAQREGDWAETRRLAEQRRTFGHRLSSHERMDAEHMVSWSSICLGEPLAALAAVDSTAAQLRPGQAPEWKLSSMIWRLRVLLTIGRWDEAMQLAPAVIGQARQLGPTAPAWTNMSLPMVLEAARGRDDRTVAEQVLPVMRSYLDGRRPMHRATLALLDDDPAGVLAALQPWMLDHLTCAELLGYLSDRRAWRADASSLLQRVQESAIVPVRVQATRALGLIQTDPGRLQEALDLARSSSDVPATARLCVETGRATGDGRLVDEGQGALAAMRDQRQLDRYG